MTKTDREWAAIFRLMQKSGALVTVTSDDWYDAEVETVGRKRVTLIQRYDYFDRIEKFEYADLNTATFWVAS